MAAAEKHLTLGVNSGRVAGIDANVPSHVCHQLRATVMPDNHHSMADHTPPPLKPADREDAIESLAYARRFDSRGKVRRVAETIINRIAAERMVEELDRAGFVVLRKPPAPAHSWSKHGPTCNNH